MRVALAPMMRFGVPLLAVAVACTPVPSPRLAIANGTDLDVTVVVNGQEIAVYPPGGGDEIDAEALPTLPWNVEARSPTGRVLTTMEVRPGDLQHTRDARGNESFSGTVATATLSCGLLILWAGYTPPSVPAPPPDAGQRGDCEP